MDDQAAQKRSLSTAAVAPDSSQCRRQCTPDMQSLGLPPHIMAMLPKEDLLALASVKASVERCCPTKNLDDYYDRVFLSEAIGLLKELLDVRRRASPADVGHCVIGTLREAAAQRTRCTSQTGHTSGATPAAVDCLGDGSRTSASLDGWLRSGLPPDGSRALSPNYNAGIAILDAVDGSIDRRSVFGVSNPMPRAAL
ncbi:hypothetical protein CKAH01_17306 [Colletotrichum kahawae]|uniref:Uncharacterized protein n=1 Tax=Colletotrichum kahawae TaxID=34407 RepID=A0AAD9YAF9_COLKA|nr:hypothetical protein CKAH01_17306 [Colletotrichum kahawae]